MPQAMCSLMTVVAQSLKIMQAELEIQLEESSMRVIESSGEAVFSEDEEKRQIALQQRECNGDLNGSHLTSSKRIRAGVFFLSGVLLFPIVLLPQFPFLYPQIFHFRY